MFCGDGGDDDDDANDDDEFVDDGDSHHPMYQHLPSLCSSKGQDMTAVW